MVVPIVASVCRELFLSVPNELEEGALALGATRWEMVRGVILSSSRPGIAAALILGLGRALGEAIAVTQVIGAGWAIHLDLFGSGETRSQPALLGFPDHGPSALRRPGRRHCAAHRRLGGPRGARHCDRLAAGRVHRCLLAGVLVVALAGADSAGNRPHERPALDHH